MNLQACFKILLFLALLCLALAGCEAKKEAFRQKDYYAELQGKIAQEQARMDALRDKERELERRGPAPLPEIEPVLPEFDPLDESRVTLQAVSQPLSTILYGIARDAGLNLVVEPSINLENTVTVSFEDARAKVVVDKLLAAYDYAWEVDENVLYVKRYEEKIFHLDFLNTVSKVTIESGGDIFGTASATGGGGGGNQRGNFEIDTDIDSQEDDDSLYGRLRKNLEDIIKGEADEGESRVVLNPLAGTLYVKAPPSRVRSIGKIVHELRSRLAKQVVIDAKFIEVRLSDGYAMGIDWGLVNTHILNNEKWGLSLALTPIGKSIADIATPSTWSEMMIARSDKSPSFNNPEVNDGDLIRTTIKALETFGQVNLVSNPHVRARHAQPALFTTGRSEAYVSRISSQFDENGRTHRQNRPDLLRLLRGDAGRGALHHR